jgi:DNA topoisomerase-1
MAFDLAGAKPLPLPADAREAAKAVGLRYVSDQQKGVSRVGAPGRFRYRSPDGKWIRDRQTLARIKGLVIPPAWTRVWIAPGADAHLQATGRDARSRKQYRYHVDFAQIRDAVKYAHLVEFAEALPDLRRRLKRDLGRPGLPRERILATVVTLLEQTLIRIGNEDYARANNSFGLTTLRNRHVKVKGTEVRFLFKGKSGKQWSLALRDRRVARVVRSCQDLPGQHLFEYRGDDGAAHGVSSSDVNDYLREITGRDITAKDFRTWAGTVKAAMGFREQESPVTKRAVRQVIAAVAEELGNTVAVCRKCYIHPGVLAGFEAGTLTLRMPARGRDGMSPQELAVLAYLKRLARHKPAAKSRA